MKTLILVSALCLGAAAQSQSNVVCPEHSQHEKNDEHAGGVDKRGDQAMGFSHETTDHHFLLLPDGGIIEVKIKADHDNATR